MIDTLASHGFYIIRPFTDYVIPEFLAWWINLPHIRAQIDAGSRGTGIGYVSRWPNLFTAPRMVVSPPDVQRRIAGAIGLGRRE
ncbi:MAG: hypothetical protein R3C45_18390 [Phycisphaerales bacterium]